MRFLTHFLLSVVGALALACALSYPLFELLVPYAPHLRFDRLATRLFQLMIVIILIGLCRAHRINSREQFGLGANGRTFGAQLGRGWLLGILSLAPVAVWILAQQIRTFQSPESPFALAKLLGSALVTGWAVAWFEEVLFRGVLQKSLRPLFLSAWPTFLILSAFFASVHFLSRTAIPAESVTPHSGWLLWQGLYASFLTPERIVDALVALFVVGVFLSWLTERSGTLALAIGTHAGWVTIIKLTIGLSTLSPAVTSLDGVNPQDGFVGWAVAVWSILLLIVLITEPKALGQWLYPERYSTDRG